MSDTVLFWFRQDLRLSDNPGLYKASQSGSVLPIYILDDKLDIGAASKWWLHNSLHHLNDSINKHLQVFSGDSATILLNICKSNQINSVYWNKCYEPLRIEQDKKIQHLLNTNNILTNSFNASLLWEPQNILKSDSTPYKVFTPFYRNGCLQSDIPKEPLSKPENIQFVDIIDQYSVDDLKLLSSIPWHVKLDQYWNIGELAAQKKLYNFLHRGLSGYKQKRNYPSKNNVSRLSPHLHYGEISPNQIWYSLSAELIDQDGENFLSELGWREFSYYLLYHFPDLPNVNFQTKFNNFPWKFDKELFKGCYTALITPFTDDYQVDYAGLSKLIEFQISENISGILIAGTTGESPTLSWSEHEKIIKTVYDVAGEKTVIIAGTGSNNTSESLKVTQFAYDLGITNILLIDPYYNGPSSLEIRKEYLEIIAKKLVFSRHSDHPLWCSCTPK
jgi:deoxyribodipyrimidine photo-lyase